MKIKAGRCYKVRNDSSVKCVKVLQGWNTTPYDMNATIIYKNGRLIGASYDSSGNVTDPSYEHRHDLVEEYNPTTGQDLAIVIAVIGLIVGISFFASRVVVAVFGL